MARRSTASKSEETLDASAERPSRPLHAMLSAAVVALASTTSDAKPKTNGGRWGLNAGSVMTTCVSGLNMQRDSWGDYAAPIRLVVDLAGAKFAKPVVPALGEHWWDKIIGNWSNGAITAARIEADLTIYEARTPAEAAALPECVRAKALLEQGHPWQASIGAFPEDGLDGYEEVEFGDSIEVNGATLTADDEDMPTFVMRKAIVTEASVCTFGADDNTGPLAAASARRRGQLAASASTAPTTSKDSSAMKYNLRAMLTLFAAHAALVAEHVAAAQELPEDKQPTAEALQASIEKAIDKAEIKAAKEALAAREAELATLRAGKPPGGAVTKPGKTEAATAPPFIGGNAEGESDAPATVHAAMAQLHSENDKLKGFRLRAAALKRWPELRKTIPDAQVGAR